MKDQKCPGRPREFDPDKALEAAMCLFWRKGYEGTSLSDLTEAMGINRPSLYAAFGNKEELFQKVLKRYSNGPASVMCQARELPTAREGVEVMLYQAAASLSNSEHPGCLMITGGLACSDEASAVQQALSDSRNLARTSWQERFERAKQEGDLPPDTDAAALAQYIITVLNGMTIQARSGATPEELRKVVALALRAWPK